MKRKRVQPGASSAAVRRAAFIAEYLRNGRNATQAAIAVGYSPKTAKEQASRLLANANVSAAVQRATEEASKITGLTTERTLREVARLAYFDPAKLYDEKGALKPVHELDEDTRAAIAAIEVDSTKTENGEITITKKIKHWDKNAALEKAMKHLGLYQRDNAQRNAWAAMSDEELRITIVREMRSIGIRRLGSVEIGDDAE